MLDILCKICEHTSKEELHECLVAQHRNALESKSSFLYAMKMISKSKPDVARILTSSLKMDYDIFPKMETFVRNKLDGNLGELLGTKRLTENSIDIQPQELKLPDVKSSYYKKLCGYELVLKHYCSDENRPLVKLLLKFIKLSANCVKPSDFAKCEQHFEKYAAACIKEVEKPYRQRKKLVTVRPFELGMGILKKVFKRKEKRKPEKNRTRKHSSEGNIEVKKARLHCDGTEGYKQTFRTKKMDKADLQEPSGRARQQADLQEGNVDQQRHCDGTERNKQTFREGKADKQTFREGKADKQTFRKGKTDKQIFREGKTDKQTFREEKKDKQTFRKEKTDMADLQEGNADQQQHCDGTERNKQTFRKGRTDKSDLQEPSGPSGRKRRQADLQERNADQQQHCDGTDGNMQTFRKGKTDKSDLQEPSGPSGRERRQADLQERNADQQQLDDGAKTSNQAENEEKKVNADLQKHGNGCGERLEKNHRKEVIEESIKNRELYLMYLKCMLEYIFELPRSRLFLYHDVPPLQMELKCLREKCEQVPTHFLTAIYKGLNSMKGLAGRVAWQVGGCVTYQGNHIFNVMEVCQKKHQCNTNNSDAVPSNLTELFRTFTNKRCTACATLPELEKLITLLDEEVMDTKAKRNNSTPDYEQNEEVEEEL